MRRQFQALGVIVPAEALQQEDEDVIEVWTSNAKAWKVFIALLTQWRLLVVDHRAFRLGLDYSAAEVVMRSMGMYRQTGRVFADLRVLEDAALEAFAEASN